jgi:hypothetical protein
MLLVLRLSRLLLKSLTTLCAYGNFALHKIVPQYVLSPSAYVHSYEVCRRRAATAAQWFQMAKKRWKKVHPKWFHEFFHASFCKFTLLPFPVACVSHSKLVKSLQAQVWSVNFTNILNLVFGGIMKLDPTVRHGCSFMRRWDVAFVENRRSLGIKTTTAKLVSN